MFLQEAPAETFNYMAFGFIVILGTMGLYILSLINRYRNLERDMELLDELMRLAADYFNPGRAPNTLCKKCGAPLLWVKTATGANAPLDPVMIVGIDADGISHRVYLNHFSTCPKAHEVAAEQKAHAAALPEDGKSKAAR